MEVVGGDAEDPQALPLPKELLLSRVDSVLGSGLGTGMQMGHRQQPGTRRPGRSWEGSASLPGAHTRRDFLLSTFCRGLPNQAARAPLPHRRWIDGLWPHLRLPPLLAYLWARLCPHLPRDPLQGRRGCPRCPPWSPTPSLPPGSLPIRPELLLPPTQAPRAPQTPGPGGSRQADTADTAQRPRREL